MKLISNEAADNLGDLLSALGELAREAEALRKENGEIAVSSCEVGLSVDVSLALFEEVGDDGSKAYIVALRAA